MLKQAGVVHNIKTSKIAVYEYHTNLKRKCTVGISNKFSFFTII